MGWSTSTTIGGSVEGWKPPSEYRRFLVKSFVGLFIFDGELSKKLLNQNETEAEKAIDALCQLYLLDEGASKLNRYWEKAVESSSSKTAHGLKMWKGKLKKLRERKNFLINLKKSSNTELNNLIIQIKELKMTKDISSTVKKMVADHLGIDEAKVTDEANFIDDLGADSLDTVELVMAFEEEFGSEISDSEAEKILTVSDAIKFIESKSN